MGQGYDDGTKVEKKDRHKMKFRKVVDNAFEAMELGLNYTLPPGVQQIEIRREIRNMMEGEGYLDLTLGMIIFELEEIFNIDLLGAVGLIKTLMENEKYWRAAMGKRHEEEPTMDETPTGTINWEAIRRRTGDLLRAGNNVLTMTDKEIITSVANFCRVDASFLRKQKTEMTGIIREVREEIQGKKKRRKLVKPPTTRTRKECEENWRQEATEASINQLGGEDRKWVRKREQM